MCRRKEPIRCVCTTCSKPFERWRNRGSLVECTPCQNNRRVAQWKRDNPERAKAINTQPSAESKRRYAQSERGMAKGREKAVRHYHKDIEASRAEERARYAANRDVHIQRAVRRNKRLRQATPPWADQDAIAAIYAEARRLTRETGIEHQVDHFFPLRGRSCSGLHVHTNLRVITAGENRMKSNSLPRLTDGNA